jgi:hypothetical protein
VETKLQLWDWPLTRKHSQPKPRTFGGRTNMIKKDSARSERCRLLEIYADEHPAGLYSWGVDYFAVGINAGAQFCSQWLPSTGNLVG